MNFNDKPKDVHLDLAGTITQGENTEPNIEQVKQFLTERADQEVSDILPLSGGEWSRAFAFRQGDKDFVVRFGQHVEDYNKDEVAAEFASECLPVPKVKEIGEAYGGYYAISERAFGVKLDTLDGSGMQKMVPAVLKMLDALREVSLTESQISRLWPDSDTAPRRTWQQQLLDVGKDNNPRTHGWRAKLAGSPVGDGPFNEALARLQELVEHSSSDRHLIHSDLLHNNVLVQNNRITAVIDWGCALYGDFLYDLAWFSFWSSWYPAMDGIDWEQETRRHYDLIGLEVPRYKERLLCYKIHIGLDAQAYNAFTGRWNQLEINARKTLELAS